MNFITVSTIGFIVFGVLLCFLLVLTVRFIRSKGHKFNFNTIGIGILLIVIMRTVFPVYLSSSATKVSINQLTDGIVFVPVEALHGQLHIDNATQIKNVKIAEWKSDLAFNSQESHCSWDIFQNNSTKFYIFHFPEGAKVELTIDDKKRIIDTKSDKKFHEEIELPLSVSGFILQLLLEITLAAICILLFHFINCYVQIFQPKTYTFLITNSLALICLINYYDTIIYPTTYTYSIVSNQGVILAGYLTMLCIFHVVLKVAPRVFFMFRTHKALLLPFSLFVVWFSFWASYVYPTGVYMSDVYATNGYALELHITQWFGKVHELLVLTELMILPSKWTQVIVQILCFSFIFTRILAILYYLRLHRVLLIGTFTLLFFSIPVIINSIFLVRDSWFSMLLTLFLVELFYAIQQKKINTSKIVYLFNLIIITSLIRSESVIYLGFGLIIVGVYLYYNFSKLIAFRHSAILILLFYFFIPSFLFPELVGNKNKYELTSYLNPLSVIIKHNSYYLEKPEEDNITLKKVLKVDSVRKYASSYGIPNFWRNDFDHQASNEDYNQLKKLAYSVFLNNSGNYFAERCDLFFSTTGMSNQQSFKYGDTYSSRRNILYEKDPQSPNKDIQSKMLAFVVESGTFKGYSTFFSSFYFWNFSPFIIILIILIFTYRVTPTLALCSLLLLSRTIILFLLAPENQFKYYYSVYLFGLVLLPLFIIEMRNTNGWEKIKLSLSNRFSQFKEVITDHHS